MGLIVDSSQDSPAEAQNEAVPQDQTVTFTDPQRRVSFAPETGAADLEGSSEEQTTAPRRTPTPRPAGNSPQGGNSTSNGTDTNNDPTSREIAREMNTERNRRILDGRAGLPSSRGGGLFKSMFKRKKSKRSHKKSKRRSNKSKRRRRKSKTRRRSR